MGIAVSYHDKVEKLQQFDRCAGGPFDRSEWFALLATDAERPVFVLASDARTTIALPLMETAEGYDSLVNWFTFAWRALSSADDLPLELLAAAARDLRQRTHRVILNPVPDEDGNATQVAAAFREAGWAVFLEPCDENHILRPRGRDFATYWAGRPGRLRTTLQRKGHKVEAEIFNRFDEVAWGEYRSVYESSWKPEEERADLLEAFARAEGAAGRLRLGIARAGGRPVAAQFWTVENETAFIHKLAHLEDAKPLSAGTTLSAALFAHVIDTDKVEIVDFGTGSDAYKRDWMEEVRLRYRISCLDWRQPRAWPQLARTVGRHIARKLTSR